MSMVQILYIHRSIVSRNLLYNPIPHCANATILTIDPPVSWTESKLEKGGCNGIDYMSA